jgi:uncharacterized protein
MKKPGSSLFLAVIILCGSLSCARAYTGPGKPTGYVNDFAKILSAQNIQLLESKLKSLQESSGAQVAVVTISSLGDETVETYANKLFQEWGIGKKGVDNGLLILVAPNDGVARIEVGYGLEGTITDLQAGNIVRNVMIPSFKTGDYNAGAVDAVDAVSGIITGSIDATQYSDGNNLSSDGSTAPSSDFNPTAIFFIFFIVINLLARLLGRTKSWWLGGVIGAVAGAIIGSFFGFVPAGIISIIILTIIGLVFDYLVSKNPPGSGRGGAGGFWPIFLGGGRGGSGGFGGGGFGGFGGGGSGGGGASGRW